MWEILIEKEGIIIYYSVLEMLGSVYILEWIKDGIILDCKIYKYVGGILNDSFIIIKLLIINDKGIYLCIVINEVGFVFKNVILGNIKVLLLLLIICLV